MGPDSLRERLYYALRELPVIDTHEHLPYDEADAYTDEDDVLREYLAHYIKSDIVSAGLKPAQLQQALDHSRPILERWRILEPYWEYARHTGYGRALDIAVKAVYGIEQINAGTIEELNHAFLARQKPGNYARVLRDMCHIETSLVDIGPFHHEAPSDLLRRVWQPLDFLSPAEPEGYEIIPRMEAKHGVKIASLDDWLSVLEAELDDRLAQYGMRVIKNTCAYWRSLRFEKVAYADARPLFDDVLRRWNARGSERMLPGFPAALQDFMMHHLLKLANARNLTIQIHTGILEGNGNTLGNSDPSLLNNLFLEYPDVDFDLFHISYPYYNVASALCKMFPNVYIDMCWAHIISPAASVAALDDFLDAIPYNKISAFGGDYRFVDGIVGHLDISRRNISEVLARKVEKNIFSQEKALVIAKALYYDNPKRIFKL